MLKRGSVLPNTLTLLKPSTSVAGQVHPGEYPCCITPSAGELWLVGKGVAQRVPLPQEEVVTVFTARCGCGHEGL